MKFYVNTITVKEAPYTLAINIHEVFRKYALFMRLEVEGEKKETYSKCLYCWNATSRRKDDFYDSYTDDRTNRTETTIGGKWWYEVFPNIPCTEWMRTVWENLPEDMFSNPDNWKEVEV